MLKLKISLAAFDRIVINLAHESLKERHLFISSRLDERKVYESHINPDRLATFLD